MRKFFYRVKDGEGLKEIAARYNLSAYAVIYDNELLDEPSAGDVLFMRACESVYRVTPYDTLSGIAERTGQTVTELKRKNGNIPFVFYGITINV